MNSTLSDIVGRLTAAGRIGDDDVLAMRQAVYGAPEVARDDLEALIVLDGAVKVRSRGWAGFIADAMVDYVVHQQQPEDYVDDAKAAWLASACAGQLGKDGGVEALVRVLEAASGAPASLEAFVLGKVKDAVVAGGRVDAGDVALLRRLVFAGASEGDIGVTREEADALFDIDHACGAAADPAWSEFFAQAIDDALTAVSPFHLESRDDAARDEAWLASRPGLFGFFKSMVARPDLGDALDDVLHPFAGERREWESEAARMEADEAAAAPITDEEAEWLIRRLGEAPLSPAGHALIGRLKGQVADPGARLKPLFDAA
jgi:hypothetical protein